MCIYFIFHTCGLPVRHIQKCSKLFLKFSSTRFRWSSIYFFNVCKKSKSTTPRFSVLSKAYKTAGVYSRDSNCTANIHEITRTPLSCTDGCAEHGQHGFRWTKHGAFSEKAPNKSVHSRTQIATSRTRLHCMDDKGLLGKLGTSYNCTLLAESSHQTLSAVYWTTITSSLSRITLFPCSCTASKSDL